MARHGDEVIGYCISYRFFHLDCATRIVVLSISSLLQSSDDAAEDIYEQ